MLVPYSENARVGEPRLPLRGIVESTGQRAGARLLYSSNIACTLLNPKASLSSSLWNTRNRRVSSRAVVNTETRTSCTLPQ